MLKGVQIMLQSKENCLRILLDLFQIVSSVLVSHVGGTDVELEVWSKVLKVVIVWKFYTNIEIPHWLIVYVDLYIIM